MLPPTKKSLASAILAAVVKTKRRVEMMNREEAAIFLEKSREGSLRGEICVEGFA